MRVHSIFVHGDEVMHRAFRACAVVEIPKERIEVIYAYGVCMWNETYGRGQIACDDFFGTVESVPSSRTEWCEISRDPGANSEMIWMLQRHYFGQLRSLQGRLSNCPSLKRLGYSLRWRVLVG